MTLLRPGKKFPPGQAEGASGGRVFFGQAAAKDTLVVCADNHGHVGRHQQV